MILHPFHRHAKRNFWALHIKQQHPAQGKMNEKIIQSTTFTLFEWGSGGPRWWFQSLRQAYRHAQKVEKHVGWTICSDDIGQHGILLEKMDSSLLYSASNQAEPKGEKLEIGRMTECSPWTFPNLHFRNNHHRICFSQKKHGALRACFFYQNWNEAKNQDSYLNLWIKDRIDLLRLSYNGFYFWTHRADFG